MSPPRRPERDGPARFEARAYLDEFALACGHAMDRAGPIVRDLRLGTTTVRLRFAGPALLPFAAPLAQPWQAPAAPEPLLTVDLWDARSTEVAPPPFPVRDDPPAGRGEIRSYDDAGLRILFQSGIDPRDGSFTALTMLDERSATARYFVRSADRIPWWERAAPLRAALHWGLGRPDGLLVHAGAVGSAGRGVLLAGAAGAGKSTSAVAAVRAGLDYLGDDYVFVDLAGPAPVAHSLYTTAKLAPDAAALLPGLTSATAARPADAEKVVVDVSQLRSDAVAGSTRVVAILLPRLNPGVPAGVRRITAGAALRALAPTTIFQGPRRDAAELRPLSELARRVQAYVLDLGDSPEQIGPVVARLLAEEERG